MLNGFGHEPAPLPSPFPLTRTQRPVDTRAPVAVDYRQFPILVVDDEQDVLRAFEFSFEDDFTIVTADGGSRGLELLAEHDAAVIVADQRMPGMNGAEFLERSIDLRPDAVRVVLTGFTDLEVLIQAVNAGRIYRYESKPWDDEQLRVTLRRAFEHFMVTRERDRLASELKIANEKLALENAYLRDSTWRAKLVGSGPAMQRIHDQIGRVAPLPTTVLITGQTGTGKDLVAHAIHDASPRSGKTFFAVNCAEIPKDLQESQLFGHRRGAFTSAIADRKGLFELADGSTLFLDEITETSLEFQSKLLRVLQEREIMPIGDTKPRKVDFRLIVASNRDLKREVAEGRFREDLYYRLNSFPISVPPLCERREDVPELASHLLRELQIKLKIPVGELTDGTLAMLGRYAFPGNVRELANELEGAVIRADPGMPITEDLFSEHLREPAIEPTSSPLSLEHERMSFERDRIRAALDRCDGVKKHAAEELGMTYRGLQKKMNRLGMN